MRTGLFAGRVLATGFFLIWASAATIRAQEHNDKGGRGASQSEDKGQGHGGRGQERAPAQPQQARPAAPQQREQPHPAPQQREQARPAPQHDQARPVPPQHDQARPAPAAREQARPAPEQRPQATQTPQQQRDRQQPQAVQRAPERQQPQPRIAAQQNRAYSVPQRSEAQARGWQQQRGWQKQGSWTGSSSWQQNRARQWQTEHRSWGQRGGYGGYYIPETRFVQSFGPQHWFRIRSQPVIVEGYPRFQYGGYWFMLADPWPESWPQDWYASDDVYLDYSDGYYLHDRRDPGLSIAISVVL